MGARGHAPSSSTRAWCPLRSSTNVTGEATLPSGAACIWLPCTCPPRLALPKDTEALCAVPGRTSEAGKPTRGSRRQMKRKVGRAPEAAWTHTSWPTDQSGREALASQPGGGSKQQQHAEVARDGDGGSDLSGDSDVQVDVALPRGCTAGLAAALQGQPALCRQEVADGAAPQLPLQVGGPQWPPGQKGREKTRDRSGPSPRPHPFPAS